MCGKVFVTLVNVSLIPIFFFFSRIGKQDYLANLFPTQGSIQTRDEAKGWGYGG